MRIISLALRQRIFGSIRKEGLCAIWCGDPKDALIFRGKKHQVHEIAFHLFCFPPEEVDVKEISPCRINTSCIAPNHLRMLTIFGGNTHRIDVPWKQLKTSLLDRMDIMIMYQAGVSKRTLKQWYMLETDELDYVLRNDHVLRKPLK